MVASRWNGVAHLALDPLPFSVIGDRKTVKLRHPECQPYEDHRNKSEKPYV